MYFCRSWFSNMVSFRYVLVFLNFLHDIFSIKFYTISFLWKHNFFIDEKHTQWMLDTKVKVFHESILCFMKWPWNCISWNALKEKFHSVSFPLYIHFFFDKLTYSKHLTRTRAIEPQLTNVGFKMLFRQRIFCYNLKVFHFIKTKYSFFEFSIIFFL